MKAAGQSLAAARLGAKEAAEMNLCNYMTGLALDVEAYRVAVDKMEEEKEAQQKQWSTLLTKHIQDVHRFQNVMQLSEFVLWQPLARKSMNKR